MFTTLREGIHQPGLASRFSQTKPGLQEQDAEFQVEVVDETHETNPATIWGDP